MMNRAELSENIDRILKAEIMPLFVTKNGSYGDEDDGFFNFRKAAGILYNGDESLQAQFWILMSYVLKHTIALSNRDFSDFEFRQRCKDIIVYMLIAMSMEDDQKEEEPCRTY